MHGVTERHLGGKTVLAEEVSGLRGSPKEKE